MNPEAVIGIRRAEPDETELLAGLVDITAASFDLPHWRRQSAVPGSFTYVMEQKSIFGFVSAGSAELLDESIGEVFGLWLNPEFRRQGLGRKLLVRGLSVLKRRGNTIAHVYLTPDNRPAELLLASLDFLQMNQTRQLNQGDTSISQIGYQLDLKDYF